MKQMQAQADGFAALKNKILSSYKKELREKIHEMQVELSDLPASRVVSRVAKIHLLDQVITLLDNQSMEK